MAAAIPFFVIVIYERNNYVGEKAENIYDGKVYK